MAVELGKHALRVDRTWSDAEFARYTSEIEAKRGWGYYHNIVVEDQAGKRLETGGPHACLGVIRALDQHGFPATLAGKTVLDIGCNAGFYSTVSKIRGASRVVGLDPQPHYVEQAKLFREITGSDIDFRLGDGHSLSASEGLFDFVINTGIIYHLQNPMDFLSKMAAITKDLMYLETEALVAPELTDTPGSSRRNTGRTSRTGGSTARAASSGWLAPPGSRGWSSKASSGRRRRARRRRKGSTARAAPRFSAGSPDRLEDAQAGR